jgi:hypothetical protein
MSSRRGGDDGSSIGMGCYENGAPAAMDASRKAF